MVIKLTLSFSIHIIFITFDSVIAKQYRSFPLLLFTASLFYLDLIALFAVWVLIGANLTRGFATALY